MPGIAWLALTQQFKQDDLTQIYKWPASLMPRKTFESIGQLLLPVTFWEGSPPHTHTSNLLIMWLYAFCLQDLIIKEHKGHVIDPFTSVKDSIPKLSIQSGQSAFPDTASYESSLLFFLKKPHKIYILPFCSFRSTRQLTMIKKH